MMAWLRKFARGGRVFGPRRRDDDSVPAFLSPGGYFWFADNDGEAGDGEFEDDAPGPPPAESSE